MDIKEMSDREKSVMLAQAMGCHIQSSDGSVGILVAGKEHWYKSLYDPANMALAWLVLNWGINGDRINIHASYDVFIELGGWLRDEFIVLAITPSAEAQRLWLDKVLQLAIEAGMVTAVTPIGK